MSAPTGEDLASLLDALRIAVGEVDALAAVAVESFDNADWGGVDPLQVERMAHLLGVLARSATESVAVVDKFRTVVADAQPAKSGDEW